MTTPKKAEADKRAESVTPQAHPCPFCKKVGATHILTPKGNKLECAVCRNVYWASDPTGAKSENR